MRNPPRRIATDYRYRCRPESRVISQSPDLPLVLPSVNLRCLRLPLCHLACAQARRRETLPRTPQTWTGPSAPPGGLGAGAGPIARDPRKRQPRGIFGDLVDGKAGSDADVPLGGPVAHAQDEQHLRRGWDVDERAVLLPLLDNLRDTVDVLRHVPSQPVGAIAVE